MGYKIYIDLFFLQNFIMNCLLLKGTCWILGKQVSIRRLMVSGATGGLLNCLFLMTGLTFPGMSFLISVLMSLLLEWTRRRDSLYAAGTLFFFAFCMEGGIRWGQFFWRKLVRLIRSYEETLSMKKFSSKVISSEKLFSEAFLSEGLLDGGMVLGIFLVLGTCYLISRRRKKGEKEIQVTLHFKGRQKMFQGFYDSGNLLQEPVTGRMVHIACYDEIKELLPEPYCQVAEEYFQTGIFESTKVTKLQMYEFTFLSYHSIGKETGQLLGIRMDWAVFEGQSGKKRAEKVVIALANQKLFVKGNNRIIINGRLEL